MKLNFKEDKSQFWDDIYLEDDAGWDLKCPTPVFESISESIPTGKLCIIGCGRGYDAVMFAQNGFDVTAVDFAPSAIKSLKTSASLANVDINTVKGDLFLLAEEYPNAFDYIIEQTCFCAINPNRRNEYERVVRSILKPGGQLIGLWFPLDKTVEEGGPPYATRIDEVKTIFGSGWEIVKEEFPELSIEPRKGREILIIFKKN